MDDGETRDWTTARSSHEGLPHWPACSPRTERGPASLASIMAVPHGVVIVDINGHIAAMNDRADAIFHCRPGRRWASHLAQLIGEDYLRTYLSCLATGAPCEGTPGICAGRPVLGRTEDGRMFPISLCITQVKMDGDLFAVAHVCEIAV